MPTANYEEIVRKCYRELLNREPDEEGFNHYVGLLKKNEIDEKQLIEIIKESVEYQGKHNNGKITDSPEDKKLVEKIRYHFMNTIEKEIEEGGLKYYFHQIKNNYISVDDLPKLLKKSEEYKEAQNGKITDSPEDKKLVEKIRYHFMNTVERGPDEDGLKSFFHQIKNNYISVDDLPKLLKESEEYKSVHDVGTVSHPIEIDPNTRTDLRMKKEWDARAELDPLLVIAISHSQNEDDFWNSGVIDCKEILGMEEQRFSNIVKNKEPSNMRILEIGCGIGRILIPMAKIFGEAIGVDVSSKMVQLGQKYVTNTPNCKILESNGINLSLFPDNHFDFCYSYIVFQHIPEKKIVQQYIEEVSRVLKPECLFRFQVRGIVTTKPKGTTWDGVQFNSEEIHTIAKKNNFEILEESDFKQEYYWLTFRSKK